MQTVAKTFINCFLAGGEGRLRASLLLCSPWRLPRARGLLAVPDSPWLRGAGVFPGGRGSEVTLAVGSSLHIHSGIPGIYAQLRQRWEGLASSERSVNYL